MVNPSDASFAVPERRGGQRASRKISWNGVRTAVFRLGRALKRLEHRRVRSSVAVFAGCSLGLGPLAAHAAQKANAGAASEPSEVVPQRRIVAVRSSTPMKIDGRGDEPVWQRAQVQGDFVERKPELGAKDPRGTSVAVAYDDDALYILVRGELSADKPQIRTLRRDETSIWSDDTVTVKLDPAHDRRTAMLFAANLAGSQTDAMALNDGADYIPLDFIWEVEGHQEGRRFGLEYRIPWFTLGVRGREAMSLGFDLSRDDPHKSAVYDWRLFVPPRSPMSASSFGSLELDGALHTRRVVEVMPYALARTNFEPRFSVDPRKGPNLAAGLDARIQTGPGGYIEASVLTDFSQVDLDEVQVAGNRFRLYYPERRAFFINGLDVFNFGYQGEAQLFFSRRVGMDGFVAPIAGGLKAYGRSAKLSYGVLNVQTLSAFAPDGEQNTPDRQPENYSVGRLRVQALPQLAVGVMAVGRKRMRSQGGDALQGGLDFELRSLDTRFVSYGFVAGVWNKEPAPKPEVPEPGVLPGPQRPPSTKKGLTASLQAEYRGLYWRPNVKWLWSSDGFDAPIGFFRRGGTSQKSASLNWVPRPNLWGLRDIRTGPRVELTTTPDLGKMLTMNARYDLEFNWRNQWSAYVTGLAEQDRVLNSFALYQGFDVAAGSYNNANVEAGVSSPERLMASSGLMYRVGPKFGGVEHASRFWVRLRLGSHVSLSGTYNHRYGHLGNPNHLYNFGFFNGQAIFALNRNLSWDTLFRLNFSPERERFALQSRLRWRYRPGSDIYLVYARQSPLGAPREGDRMRHSIALKANFFFAAPVGRRR